MASASSFCLLLSLLPLLLPSSTSQLTNNFYRTSCPSAETIITDYVNKHIPNAPSLAATLIRMHFHDCFVRGCDASVLINTTATNNATEKTAAPNVSLRGFDFIDRVKDLVEKQCPGVVSCADVLTLVARDAVFKIGGPFWQVPTGRRDGTVSNATEALNQIPSPAFNVSALITSFANKGLNVTDLVVLSGAHTLGLGHCSAFSGRIYNWNGTGAPDPSFDSEYAAKLRTDKCKTANDNVTLVEMDPGSRNTFDFGYYNQVKKRRGLFSSDAALITSSTTSSIIDSILNGTLAEFNTLFARSMEKMGRIGVLTGSSGEIRKQCAVVNGG